MVFSENVEGLHMFFAEVSREDLQIGTVLEFGVDGDLRLLEEVDLPADVKHFVFDWVLQVEFP